MEAADYNLRNPMSELLTNELPVTVDPNDAPPWKPTSLYCGISIQFVEPDGRSYMGHAGTQLHGDEPLNKLLERVKREAMARCIGNGFPNEKHKQQSGAGR